MLKAIVDNIIYLDGEKIVIEAMVGTGRKESTYQITEQGIAVDKSE